MKKLAKTSAALLTLCAVSVLAQPGGVGTVGSGATAGPGGMPAIITPSSSPAPAGPVNNPAPPDTTIQNSIPTNSIPTNSVVLPVATNQTQILNRPAAGGSNTNFSGTVTNLPRRHHWWQWH